MREHRVSPAGMGLTPQGEGQEGGCSAMQLGGSATHKSGSSSTLVRSSSSSSMLLTTTMPKLSSRALPKATARARLSTQHWTSESDMALPWWRRISTKIWLAKAHVRDTQPTNCNCTHTRTSICESASQPTRCLPGRFRTRSGWPLRARLPQARVPRSPQGCLHLAAGRRAHPQRRCPPRLIQVIGCASSNSGPNGGWPGR